MRNNTIVRKRIFSAAILAIPVWGLAQTSGSYTFNGDSNWGDAVNWNPAIPNGGGAATFFQNPKQSGTRSIVMNVPVTLNSIVFDSAYQYILSATGGNVLTLSGPATFSVVRSNSSTPSLFAAGHVMSVPITGSGGLTKTGPGNLTLTGTNSFSGGLTVTGGSLRTTIGDFALGDGSGTVTLSGGALRITNATFTSSRSFVMGAGGGTFEMFANGTFNGVISGSGTLNKTIAGGMIFQAANTYTGVSNFQARGTLDQGPSGLGVATFTGSGSSLNTTAINSGGAIALDNTANNLNDRIPSVPMNLYGSAMFVRGNSGAPTNEVMGAVTTQDGQTFFTLIPDASQPAQMTFASLTRLDKGTQVFRGTGLGGAPASNVANIFFTAAPTLVGGGGAAGSTNISILPGAIGSTGTTSAGDSFVTYGANGVRPLATTEYLGTLSGAAATDNVRLTAAAAPPAAVTVNSLVIAAGGALGATGTVTITSGQFLNAAAATHAGKIDFGTAEGLLNMPSAGTFTGVINGSGGLVKSGSGTATMTGANTYTGQTTILAGVVIPTTNVPAGANGPFGNSTTPIVLAPGSSAARIWCSLNNAVFDRDLIVRGLGVATAAFGVTADQALTMNGNIALERELSLEGGPATGPTTINGTISGVGRITDGFDAVTILNHANTFSGGVRIGTGGFFAGDDAAFGTGTIWFEGSGTIGAFGALRTIANPITLLSGFNIGTIAGGGQPITFTGPVNLGGGDSGNSDGQFVIAVAAGVTGTFNGVIGDGGIAKTGQGILRLLGNNSYTGGTTVGDGLLIANKLSNGALSIVGGTVQITQKGTANSPSGTTVVPSLEIIPGTAILDLTNNSMVIDYSGPIGTTIDDLRDHLKNARLITTAAAPANTRLGYADNAALGRTTFAGVSVDSSSVLIKFTYSGDADLDGDADGVDIGTWATNFTGELGGGAGATHIWTQGDWDYDGDIDGVDAGLWATAFTGELGGAGLGDIVVSNPLLDPQAAHILQGLGITVVPEPGSGSLLAASLLLIRRRRR